MNGYLETSALLSWLLAEPEESAVEAVLRQARHLFTSELTVAETLRAIQRHNSPQRIQAQERLRMIQSRWNALPMHSALLQQVGQAFPVEPVRTLDAIHLVTAMDMRGEIEDLRMISLDRRVRENATALGFTVLPA